jgi:hypothetical protein
MGMVHAYKKGELKGSELSKAIKDAAKKMKKKSSKDYAKTKHTGLPNKVKKESVNEDWWDKASDETKADYVSKHGGPPKDASAGDSDSKEKAKKQTTKKTKLSKAQKDKQTATKRKLQKKQKDKKLGKTISDFKKSDVATKIKDLPKETPVSDWPDDVIDDIKSFASKIGKPITWLIDKLGFELPTDADDAIGKWWGESTNLNGELINEKKNPKREKAKKNFLKYLKSMEKEMRRIKYFVKANQWGAISSFVDDGLAKDMKLLQKEIDAIISLPIDESIDKKIKDVMGQLVKSMRLKSVKNTVYKKGAMSFFVDDEKEANRLEKLLKRSFKRVRKIDIKGKPTNFVVAGDMLSVETVDEDRDYKAEYKKYGSSTKAKKYRAELNQYNRKKGTYGNGDGKDASHKGGKIVGFEAESKNRGRAEKSRLKKESVNEAKKYSDDWNLTKRVTSNFIKQNLKSVDNSIKKKDGEGLRFHLNQIIKGIQNAKRALKLESVNEAIEPAGNMAKIQKIVKDKQATKLGGVMVDMQSASLLMKLYDKVSDKDKDRMNKFPAKKLTLVISRLWSRINLKLPM